MLTGPVRTGMQKRGPDLYHRTATMHLGLCFLGVYCRVERHCWTSPGARLRASTLMSRRLSCWTEYIIIWLPAAKTSKLGAQSSCGMVGMCSPRPGFDPQELWERLMDFKALHRVLRRDLSATWAVKAKGFPMGCATAGNPELREAS